MLHCVISFLTKLYLRLRLFLSLLLLTVRRLKRKEKNTFLKMMEKQASCARYIGIRGTELLKYKLHFLKSLHSFEESLDSLNFVKNR